MASSRWPLKVRSRRKPYVFSHKARPSCDVGNLVCATGPAEMRAYGHRATERDQNPTEHVATTCQDLPDQYSQDVDHVERQCVCLTSFGKVAATLRMHCQSLTFDLLYGTLHFRASRHAAWQWELGQERYYSSCYTCRASRQDSDRTRANRIERKWHHQKRKPRKKNVREKKTPRQTAGNRKGNRIKQKWRHQKFKEKEIEDKRASRQRDGIRTSWQEERAPRERNVKGQEFQEMTPSTAVAARRSGVVPIGFPFSLQASLPFETFAGPGSTGTYVHVFFVMIYMYIYMFTHIISSYNFITFHFKSSFHFISYHITSYHITSYRIISFHVIISDHIIWFHVELSFHIISYRIFSYHIISYIFMTYHIISFHIKCNIICHIIS